jgi:mono/diheme cytochrome c family protein
LTRSKPIARPGLGLILRQLGVAAVIAALWGALFGGYTQLVGVQVPTPAAASTPRATRTQSPTFAPTAVVAAVTPLASATSPAASPTAAVAASNTPAPSTSTPAVATGTSVPATNTPAAARLTPTATTLPQAGAVSFSKNVLPIFESICVKCHGGEDTNASLVLKSYADVMQGSENGPVIEPGKSADSLLIQLITEGKMPKKGPKLLPAQIRIITQWVDAGAPDN